METSNPCCNKRQSLGQSSSTFQNAEAEAFAQLVLVTEKMVSVDAIHLRKADMDTVQVQS